MNQKKQKKNKIKEFFKSIGVFVGKGVLMVITILGATYKVVQLI